MGIGEQVEWGAAGSVPLQEDELWGQSWAQSFLGAKVLSVSIVRGGEGAAHRLLMELSGFLLAAMGDGRASGVTLFGWRRVQTLTASGRVRSRPPLFDAGCVMQEALQG